jgi:phosphopantothenoylcysteine synthetase/decarboxylase
VAAAGRGHHVTILAPWELPYLNGPLPATVEHRKFFSVADLQNLLAKAATEKKWDAVIHAAAVSDYTPASVTQGKISSDQDELIVRLVRTPKLIKFLRDQYGDALLVGFKLLSGVDPAERKRIALEQMAKCRTDACIENDIKEFGPGEHKARIITPDGTEVDIPKSSKAEAASRMVDFVEARVGQRVNLEA